MNHLDHIDPRTVRLLPGRALLEIEAHPDVIGFIVVPDIAQVRNADADSVSLTGTVLAIGYGDYLHDNGGTGKRKLRRGVQPGEILTGDKVRFRATLDDLDQSRVIVDVRRIDAVLEPTLLGSD